MRKSGPCIAAVLLCAVCQAAAAQDVDPWDEYDKLIKTRESVTTHGPDLFGDNVDLASGALSFSATDVSVPGNSRLPVAFTRTFTVTNRKGYVTNDSPLADWELDTPRLSSVFATNWPDQRCSSSAIPIVELEGKHFHADDYWNGHRADMPGGGEMLLANTDAPKPTTGGPYYWVTAGRTYFSCLTSIRNGTGEGFLAITSDGTKYWFDWMAQSFEPSLKDKKFDGTPIYLPRRRNALYATRVEDRFGNSVTYTYANAWNAPARLTGVNASDGRQLVVTYNGSGHVDTVSDGSQTWRYQYDYSIPDEGNLNVVVLPDQSRWTINFAALSSAAIRYQKTAPSSGEAWRDCFNPGDVNTPGASGTITHPSGAVGEFAVEPIRHGRSNVPALCGGFSAVNNDPNDDVAYFPINWDSLSVVSKRVSGLGIEPATWTYAYTSAISSFNPSGAGGDPVCGDSSGCVAPKCTSDECAGTSITSVIGPDNHWARYTFGNSYRYNEGKLLKVESGSDAANILKTVTATYNLAQSNQPYLTPIGTSLSWRGDGFTSEYIRPQVSAVIEQDGVTFSSQVSMCGTVRCFDAFGRPTRIAKTSSLGYAKSEATEYYDDASKWVLGQVKRVLNGDNDDVISQTDFDAATALPLKQYRFGKLQQTLTYNIDGTVATVRDGNDNLTTASIWKRGIPQLIRHPATPESPTGATESAVVNNQGRITSVTDENNYTTAYGYDAMGRLAGVVYPGSDVTAWNSKALSFQPVTSDAYGLPAGHWRQVLTQGNYKKTLYFDALWRPVVEQEEDTANPTGTLRWITRRYDASGRLVFESYPRNPYVDGWVNAGAAVNGTRTFYDELDRVVRVEQDSELGVLATTTRYLPGFRREDTDPKQHTTTTSYEAYDSPDAAQPVQIQAPEGSTTSIVRNAYGQPTAVSRWGSGN